MISAYTTSFVSTAQGTISIMDTEGSGKPVFFIHGNSACKEAFSKQFHSDLTHKYRFIAMDLPGHGESDKAKDPETTYNIPGYADVAIEVIRKLGLEKPVVVGWSLGGHIGLNMLEKTHKLAGVLITGSPPIEFSSQGFQKGFLPLPIFQTLFSKIDFTDEDADLFMSEGGFDTKQDPFIVEAAKKTDGYARKYLAESLGKGIGGDQKKIAEENDTPLCVVQGKNDKGINNDYVTKQVNYRNLFNNKVHIIDNAEHAVFWEKPEEFNQTLSSFLSHVVQ